MGKASRRKREKSEEAKHEITGMQRSAAAQDAFDYEKAYEQKWEIIEEKKSYESNKDDKGILKLPKMGAVDPSVEMIDTGQSSVGRFLSESQEDEAEEADKGGVGWSLVGGLPLAGSKSLMESWHVLSPSQSKQWLQIQSIGDDDWDTEKAKTKFGNVIACSGDKNKIAMCFDGELEKSLLAGGVDPNATRLGPKAVEFLEKACEAARGSCVESLRGSSCFDLAWTSSLVLKLKNGEYPDMEVYLRWLARRERDDMADGIAKASKDLMLASGLRARAQKVAENIERARSERRVGMDMSGIARDIESEMEAHALKALKVHKQAVPFGCGYTAAQLAKRLSSLEAQVKLPLAAAGAAHASSLKHFCFDGAFGSELARMEPKDLSTAMFDSMPAWGASLSFPSGSLEEFAGSGLRAHWSVGSIGGRRMATLAMQWRFSLLSDKDSADNVIGLTIDIDSKEGPDTLELLEAEWNRQMSRIVSKSEFSLGPANPGWTAKKAKNIFDRMDQASAVFEKNGFELFLKNSPIPQAAKDVLEKIWLEGYWCIESAFNGLSYVCCQNADMAREVVDKSDSLTKKPTMHPEFTKAAGLRAGLLSGKFEQDVIWCGASIGQELRNRRVMGGEALPTGRGSKAKTSYHIRRAHPHGYWIGAKDGVQKLVVKWVKAVAVNAPKQMSAKKDDGGEVALLFPNPSGYSMPKGPK